MYIHTYVYIDGSGIDSQIGAAAYCPMLGDPKQQYLGPDSSFNVYVEVTAVKLATEILRVSDKRYDKCKIYVDSQPAIKGIVKPAIWPSNHPRGPRLHHCIQSLQSEQPNPHRILGMDPGSHEHSGK